MNWTSMRPAYSCFNSFRTGAIILQGMHLSAPRSTRRGRSVLTGALVGAALGVSAANADMGRNNGQQQPDWDERWLYVRARPAARRTAAATRMGFLDVAFMFYTFLFSSLDWLLALRGFIPQQ